MCSLLGRTPAFTWIERGLLGYALYTGLIIFWGGEQVPHRLPLLILRGGLLLLLWSLPVRGAAWEHGELSPGRAFLRFLRYSYPLLLILYFFEEVQWTVNALWEEQPYWFEPFLYEADRRIFGELPLFLLARYSLSPPLNELMHAFYFSYYVILISGLLLAWRGSGRGENARLMNLAVAGMLFGYLGSFFFYPLLPARGPWENPELMAQVPPFRGYLFKFLIDEIIQRGAVSGGCFPSSHVSGSWGLILGLGTFRPRPAIFLAVLAVGMSFSCVYTRYHHGVDVLAGLAVGVAGGSLARFLFRAGPSR